MEDIKARFVAVGQGHVFDSWAELNEIERAKLLEDAVTVPLDELNGLFSMAKNRRMYSQQSRASIRPLSSLFSLSLPIALVAPASFLG